jgi:CRP/FNR family transcriptional regulator, cyclic AMP receptor protein
MQRLWSLSHFSLFERLNEVELRSLEKNAFTRRFPKDSAIYVPRDAADHVCLLAEGRIRLCSTTPDGKRAILGFVEVGEIFGELALIEEIQREERAEAERDSTVVLVRKETVQKLMDASAHLTMGITKLIGFRRTRVERRLRNLLFRSNRDRLMQLLLELADRYGKQTSQGIALEIRLSQQDIAAIIGATRESVTNVLGELQLEGLIKVARQNLVIRDLRRLAALANAEIPTVAELSRVEMQNLEFARAKNHPSS